MTKKTLAAAGLTVLTAVGIGTATATAAPVASAAPAPAAPSVPNPTRVQLHSAPDVNSPVVGDYQLTPADFAKPHVAGNGGQFVQVPGGWALLPF